jgi:membrane fusion protein (multidrug efflux system)
MQTAHESSNITHLSEVESNRRQQRKRWLTRLGMVVALAGLLVTLYWLLYAANHVKTDNAYAAADIAYITPATNGTVKSISVVDTQSVKAGDILVTLDDTDAHIALMQAEANLARAETEFARAETNLKRRQTLASRGYVSTEELDNFANAFKVAKANLDLVNATLDQARLDLGRTIIRAPVDGIVAKRDVQLGQRIVAGAHLLSIIPISQMYVNANFKEVQLKKVKVGQPVELHADLYGSSVTYRGHVAGLAAGTGSAFAVIPSQNATGNWIKVVQRLPVRIELEKDNLAKYPLRVGLSMQVDIYTGTKK